MAGLVAEVTASTASYDLHAKLPCSRLHFVVAGHSASETAIREKLVQELERFAKDPRGG